jgi:hypothetical protein
MNGAVRPGLKRIEDACRGAPAHVNRIERAEATDDELERRSR